MVAGALVILTLHELTLAAYNGSGKRRILSVVDVVMVTDALLCFASFAINWYMRYYPPSACMEIQWSRAGAGLPSTFFYDDLCL